MFEQSRIRFITFAICAIVLALSCTLSRSPDTESNWSLIPKLGGKSETLFQKYTYDLNESVPIFSFYSNSSCKLTEKSRQELKIAFTSLTGTHELHVQLSADNKHKATLDAQAEFQIAANIDPFMEHCQKLYNKNVTQTDETAAKAITKQLLNLFAPQCDLIFSAQKGWLCNSAPLQTTITRETIQSIQKAVLKGARQPYSLSRKIAVTKQLWQALAIPTETPKRLNIICNVLELSDESERPLVLTYQPSMTSLCDSNNPARIEVAKNIVNYAVQEIMILKDLFRDHTRLGLIQVKLPSDISPSKDLWVSVVPVDDVETRWNQLMSIQDKTKTPKESTCWHPFFGQKRTFTFHAAILLGMVKDNQSSDGCVQALDATEDTYKSTGLSYVFRSITSESEFVISNGNAKLVRLPAGQYTYVIQSHSKLPEDLVVEKQKSTTGEFAWQARRPSIVIKKW